MISNQSQKGGDSSTNIQAQKMVMYVGIDEKRAREICQEMNLKMKLDYSQEALNTANSRVAEFENRLLLKMAQVEGALEAFADPSFQRLLVEAQKTAVSTERPKDYDLLSELLMHRFLKGENRVTRAGISVAVEIVDKVSDDALLGLTAIHAVSSFSPTSGDIHEGLNSLNDFFGKIFYSNLPTGDEWLDHLDLLSAVRINPSGNLKKITQFYSEILSGYVDVGINKNSENYGKAIEILNRNNLPRNILVEHTLNSEFSRVLIRNISSIDEVLLHHSITPDGRLIFFPEKLSEDRKKAIISIYDLYSEDKNIKQKNINFLMNEWDKRPNLKILKEWWDNISTCFSITSAGKVLAHSNAQRCDNNLPALD